MTDLDQVEKYLKWSLEKVVEIRTHYKNDALTSSSEKIVKNNLITDIELALSVARRM